MTSPEAVSYTHLLVEPGHQQVGLAGLIVVQRKGSAGCEEIDDVEVVDIGDEGGDLSLIHI